MPKTRTGDRGGDKAQERRGDRDAGNIAETDRALFEGGCAGEAIDRAAKALGVPPETVSFTVLSAGSPGFFGIGRKKVRILADRAKSLAAAEAAGIPAAGRDAAQGFSGPAGPAGFPFQEESPAGRGQSGSTSDASGPYGGCRGGPAAGGGPEAPGPQGRYRPPGASDGGGTLPSSPEPRRPRNSPRPGSAPAGIKLSGASPPTTLPAEALSDPSFSGAGTAAPVPLLPWKSAGYSPGDFAAVPGLAFAGDTVVLPAPETLPPPGGFAALPPGPWTHAAKEFLEGILERMSFEAEVEALRLEQATLLTVRCPDSAILIGRRGVGLDALELVLSRMLERKLPEPCGEARRVVVDSEDYRARRHLGLLQKTFIIAGEALSAGRRLSIPQLSPPERHLVRAALKNLVGVAVSSTGTGALRNVTISPVLNADACSEAVWNADADGDAEGGGESDAGGYAERDGKLL
ncbi:MAG: Jag N-terminal domain-containing protein [Deltaproteobacteria bacterium]|nr:Jag N-terminal domain-containing protein [Deltaproteobacteria bacterium]